MTTAEAISGWARRFVAASALFLVVWQVGTLVGVARRTGVILGVFGFVLHMIFGKAYALIPSYFDRDLELVRLQPAHFGLSVSGTVLLAVEAEFGVPGTGALGGLLWAGGAAAFLAAIVWTIRDNPTGRETGTSEANEDRQPIDRLANGFMPVALSYLALGSYETLAFHTPLPGAFSGYFPRVAHLLAAGAAATLVFAIGFRLLPRFLVAHPPGALVAVVLPAGTLGPILIAQTLGTGPGMLAGATLEAIAVLGFGVAFLVLYYRSARRRVGFYGVLAGVLSGSLGVALGLSFAFSGWTPALATAHFRLNVLGFLGLTIVGTAYQFYPPAVGTFPGASDRTAFLSILGIGTGLLFEAIGLAVADPTQVLLGRVLSLAGAVLYAGLLLGLFYERYWSA